MTLENIIANKNDPIYRQTQLEELRQRIKETEDLNTRTDDVFLTQFLRASGYQLNSAFYMVKGYQNYNDKYTDEWLKITRSNINAVMDSHLVDMLPGCDAQGRRVCWLQVGKWKPRDIDLEVIFQTSALITQVALADTTTTLNSLVVIFDMKDTGFSHARAITPALAKKMVAFLTTCMPMYIQELHIINESTVLGMMYSVFKIFLNDRMRKRIHLHGSSLESLHQHADKKLLPAALGGEAPDADIYRWNEAMQTPEAVKEMENGGFQILN